ncbi:MAG: polysaccharide deacetylase family protein [Christensenellales bacterium]|jgi:peptidoglycan/xylan/chitin deacetylase (PgdA/CDA1 family)
MRRWNPALALAGICCALALLMITALIADAPIQGIAASVLGIQEERVVRSVHTSKVAAVLTFDITKETDGVPRALEILDRYAVKGVFFTDYEWLELNPLQAASIHEKGHDMGIYGPTGNVKTAQDALKEIRLCKEKIDAITGEETMLYRPAWGQETGELLKEIKELGLIPFACSADASEWRQQGAGTVIKQMAARLNKGAVLHCYADSKELELYLPFLIEQAADKGYTFVLLNESIPRGAYTIDFQGILRESP